MKTPLKARIFSGGWSGHQPEQFAKLLAEDLRSEGFSLRTDNTLDSLADADALLELDLIVPCWTMGELTEAQSQGLQKAVRAGVGLAGFHGGMGDAFRGNLDYEWMVGGHFVGHPHVGDYTVRVTAVDHEITSGMPAEFAYRSEQYYMMIDPGITVLAESLYNYEGRICVMSVVWTKHWGKGRVFYSALGHSPQEFIDFPEVRRMTLRGLVWAAAGKTISPSLS